MSANRLRITKAALPGSGPTESIVSITPGVMVAFERTYKVGVGAAFGGDASKVEYIFWMAWEAERREILAQGVVTLPFDDWLLSVSEVDDPDQQADPS